MLQRAHKDVPRRLLIALALLVALGPATLLAAPAASPANACGAACPCESRDEAPASLGLSACAEADACALEGRRGSSEEGEAEHEECPKRCLDVCPDCACCPAATSATLSLRMALKSQAVSAPLSLIEEAPSSAGRLGVFRPPRTHS